MPGIATTTPEILIAYVGSMTTRIRLGAGGVMLPNHSPLKVAESNVGSRSRSFSRRLDSRQVILTHSKPFEGQKRVCRMMR